MSSWREDDETYQRILRELETLVKAGLIEVTGITDDGQWLYSMTPIAKEIIESLDPTDNETLARILVDIIDNLDEDGNI
jgi:DNA-binding MarR family transcriptional regulator